MYEIIAEASTEEDWVLPFTVMNVDPVTRAKTPRNITGASLRCALKVNYPNDSVPAVDANTSNGSITIDDAAVGKFSLRVPQSAVAAVTQTLTGDMIIYEDTNASLLFRLIIHPPLA